MIPHGSKRTFNYPKSPGLGVVLHAYVAHRGQVVTVIGPCACCLNDPEHEPAYLIQAADGWVGHATPDELV
jgi:hypothetical protein